MTTRFRLLCHAPTLASRRAAFPGDEPVDTPGLAKLAKLAAIALPPAQAAQAGRCLTCPSLRARQTAEALWLRATVDPALRECDYGTWTGRTLAEVGAGDPGAVAEWLRDPRAAPHGGESLADLIGRVADWLGEQSREPGLVVAVTHASVIRAAILSAIGAPAEAFRRIDVGPLDEVRLGWRAGRWTLSAITPLPMVRARRGGEGS